MKREKKRANVFLKGALAALMALSCIPGSGLTTVVKAVETSESTNLTQIDGVTATASSEEVNSLGASKAIDGDRSTASRWSASYGKQEEWLKVDLQEARTFNKFVIYNNDKDAGQNIAKFKIEGSNDDSDYEVIYESDENQEGFPIEDTVLLENSVKYRYVKITIMDLIDSAYQQKSLREFEIYNDETASTTPVDVNLAQGKTITASRDVSASYGNLAPSKAVDGDDSTRWSAEASPTQWIVVDLGDVYDMNYFRILWEGGGFNMRASSYNIYVSETNLAGTDDWGTPVVSTTDNDSVESIETLENAVSGQYVKLEVTGIIGNFGNAVSVSEFEVMRKDSSVTVPQDPEENVALGKTGYASSQEASDLNANKAFDGDRTTRSSRWSSNVGNAPHWLYVDLGDVKDVKTVRLYWETRKATNYQIEISNDASQWNPVKVMNQRPTSTTDTITLDDVQKARYVRLYISASDAEDPDGGVEWNSISVYEMEVYGGTPAISMGDIGNMISVTTPTIESEKLEVTIPEVEGYTVTYNGTDLEQVIDDDLTIYHPIVDKEVNVSFKIVNDETEDYEFKEIAVTVPGTYQSAAGDNKAPAVLPELQEWKGRTGNFTLTDSSKIVYADDDLKSAADEMAADYEDLTGKTITVVKGTSADVAAGDFFFAKTEDTSLGLMKEGYRMDITNKIVVTSETQTGAYWATRTILQALKQSDFTTIPQGITRDYPMYEVRGFILDVGRKTFTMDYLEQVVKEMSWYKMNDFQVHVNDNLIGLENKEDPMTAYSAFRLENDTIKKGGILTDAQGNPLTVNDQVLEYEQDLTSTDLWYTKDEFRDFIQESRELGVNIVPEIDTPAHSLALTKVLPELRHGTSGRQNDHLDLVDSYEQCLTFVQTIFGEYMQEDNPVFDEETIVHIGADEYNASSTAYRKFVNDMIDYVEGTERKVRVWGSFTAAAEGEDINAEGVQINLWNFGYANMDQMYEDGFDLINCNDGNYYIVPNAGYYYDYLNDGTMYNLAINSIGGVTIPAGDDQMVGGAFAVWNDMTDYLDNGVSEYDVYDRISNMSLFAAKLWGKGDLDLAGAQARAEELGDAPRTNFGYEVESVSDEYMNLPMDELKDTSANNFAVNEGENAEIVEVDGKNALKLEGGKSYITTGLETVGLGSDLRVKVKRTSDSTEEQILFESPYGSIKAVQNETGQVGFSRELFDYSFNYTLPLNEWVELEFKNQQNVMQLYVNGELVDTLGDDERIEGRPMLATGMFPMATIGSETNAFIGYVDDVRIGKNADFASTMSLDYALWNAATILDDSNSATLTPLMEEAKSLLTQYDPDAAEIERLTKELNSAIEATDSELADYSRIEAYKALVADLSSFTEESAAAVQRVLDMIRYDLPAELQYVVDSYEQALVDAINGLETKSLNDLYYVDSSTMTATASSYQKDGSNPSNVLDGNKNTIWHTDWNVTDMPHWIDLEMEEPMTINGLEYTPRQSGTNGNVTSYEIQVSDDGTDYRTIKTGTLQSNANVKTISFDAVTAKHVRLVYNKAVNNNGTAAELRVRLANIEADVDGLRVAVDDAKAHVATLDPAAYTEDSWNHLMDTIDAAEALLAAENPDANDVAQMIYDLDKALSGLRLVTDKDALNATIEQAEGLDEGAYTADSWAALQEKLAAAKEVVADADATQLQVTQADDALQAAIDALVKVEAPQQADKDALQDLVDQYTGYHSTDYTAETWKPFKAAYDAAWEVLRNENATQAEVDAAYEALKAAGEALVQAPGQSSDGEETTPPAKDEETDTAAAAGAFAPWAAAGMLSALAIGFVWRKKRTEK